MSLSRVSTKQVNYGMRILYPKCLGTEVFFIWEFYWFWNIQIDFMGWTLIIWKSKTWTAQKSRSFNIMLVLKKLWKADHCGFQIFVWGILNLYCYSHSKYILYQGKLTCLSGDRKIAINELSKSLNAVYLLILLSSLFSSYLATHLAFNLFRHLSS